MCVFDGIMDASMYVSILRETLVPFLREVYPEGHRFMQDNDPKHTYMSRLAQFFDDNCINWWKTPAESPDLNPIENLWHKMKEYLRREVKARTKDQFWDTVTIDKCSRYIRHLRKVIPQVITEQGGPTGYILSSTPFFFLFSRFFSEPPQIQ